MVWGRAWASVSEGRHSQVPLEPLRNLTQSVRSPSASASRLSHEDNNRTYGPGVFRGLNKLLWVKGFARISGKQGALVDLQLFSRDPSSSTNTSQPQAEIRWLSESFKKCQTRTLSFGKGKPVPEQGWRWSGGGGGDSKEQERIIQRPQTHTGKQKPNTQPKNQNKQNSLHSCSPPPHQRQGYCEKRGLRQNLLTVSTPNEGNFKSVFQNSLSCNSI